MDKPVAWIFERASARNITTGEYVDWHEVIKFERPNVLDGSIRNLRPLTAGKIEPLK